MSRSFRASGMLAWVIAALAAVAASVALAMLHDVAFLDSDAAQYLNTARNLVAGNGLSTDLLYYEEQYRFEALPAPQTVFPPGLPVLLAGLTATGSAPAQASLIAGLAAFCLTGLLLGLCLDRMRVARPLLALGVVLWFALALAWANVLQGRSEIVFTLLTLGSVLAMLPGSPAGPRPWLAGLLAAAAISTRYQGVFFLAALGIWCLLPAFGREPGRIRQTMANAAIVLGVPAVATLLIFGRNVALLGSAGGGPIDTVRSGIGGIELARSFYWMASETTGLSLPQVARGGVAEWLAVAGALLLALGVFAARRARRSFLRDEPEAAPARRPLVVMAALYLAISVAGLLYLAATRSGAYLQGRFLVPAVPFALILWIAVLDRWLGRPSDRGRRIAVAGVLLLHGGLVVAQVGVVRSWLADLRADRRIEVIGRALATQVDGVTLGQYLQARLATGAPVFAESGQHLWLLIERPVLGAAGAGFSRRNWSAAELQRLQRCYGVQYVLFFPPIFDPKLPQNANRTLFAELARGDVPPFLHAELRTADVELYRLSSQPRGACSAAQETR